MRVSTCRDQASDTDESAASDARARYRQHGVEPLEPDESILRLLVPGEQVLAFRQGVALNRRMASSRVSVVDSIRGDLYLTTARLVHVGTQVVTVDLDEIEESALAGETVLLLLGEGVGVALDADRPRLLRVQIALARAARTRRDGPVEGQPDLPQPAR